MRTTLVAMVLLANVGTAFGQKLADCSACATQSYTESDLRENELYEIQLLRNEIFARHNYQFKNGRLNDYFAQFEWYAKNRAHTFSSADLNEHENHNIQLFKRMESTIQKERERLLAELKALQVAVVANDRAKLEALITEKTMFSAAYDILKSTLATMPLDEMHWFKGKAQFTITTDNGLAASRKSIHIKNNKVTISISDPLKHSSLMGADEAFDYPSTYFSEDEHWVGLLLIFENGRLVYERIISVD